MDLIKKELEKIILRVFRLEADVLVTPAPELSREGEGNLEAVSKPEFATNVAMKLAGGINKKLGEGEKFEGIALEKTNPREIAEVLRREFLKTAVDKLPELQGTKVEIAGPGFLNFTLGDAFYREFIQGVLESEEAFREKILPSDYQGKTVICEFSDPNPFKVLHVGHLYTSIVGDAISRLVEEAGGKVVRVNFGGDVGLHVAKTIYILLQKACANVPSRDRTFSSPVVTGTSRPMLSPVGSENSLEETVRSAFDTLSFTIEDIAQAYVEGTRAYEEDEEAKKKIVQLNKTIYKIAELGEGNEEGLDEEEKRVAEIYWRGRALSYQYFKDFYKEIGVKFDKFYPESVVMKTGLNKILEQKEKGIYSESEGAVVFPGEKFGLHTRVFINKEGLPTYEAKDVGLLFTKWADYKFDESIVITGNDIIDYMKVVLKSVEQYAPELVERTTHITHGNVRLPGNEKMSSRKGNFVRAVEVLELVNKAIEENSNRSSLDVLASSSSESQHSGSLAQSRSGNTGHVLRSQVNVSNSDSEKLRNVSSKTDSNFSIIALGAIKYYFLKYRIGGNIVFDAEESVSLTGNSGPYLLYSVVRAKKVLLACSSSSTDALLAQRMSNTSRSATPVSSNSIATKTFYNLNVYERKLSKKIVQYPVVLREAVREKAPHLVANYLFELAQEFSRFYENCPVVGSEFEDERKKFVRVFTKIMKHGLNILGIMVPEEM
ncbi:arginine--tRNA ligase [Candidatus Saccharibacteria bacterium]|nr:arginine--tRNA ligase [Candidatus Saccharibacteria bacterium]